MIDPIPFVDALLKAVRQRQGTDLFLTVGSPPTIKINGFTHAVNHPAMTAEQTESIARSLIKPDHWADFQTNHEANFAIQWESCGRFRVNVFQQKGLMGLVFREIRLDPPTADSLKLPPVMKKIALEKRGMILVVGSAGSGKTTSLAAMIDHRNRSSRNHIVSIEDPIEFIHTPLQSVITQREIGTDTHSWETGLKNALRQSPDVLVLGEIRDRTAMEYALHFAETGHLCMATIHANNASQAIERVLNLFPLDRRQQIWMDLSINLKAILGQRLVPLQSPVEGGFGRVAAYEVLVNTPLVADLLLRNELHTVRELMAKGSDHGMQTFDQSLMQLYEDGLIRFDDALRFAESINDLRIQIKLTSQRYRDERGDQTSDDLPLSLA